MPASGLKNHTDFEVNIFKKLISWNQECVKKNQLSYFLEKVSIGTY